MVCSHDELLKLLIKKLSFSLRQKPMENKSSESTTNAVISASFVTVFSLRLWRTSCLTHEALRVSPIFSLVKAEEN